jgi:hypothetical protein
MSTSIRTRLPEISNKIDSEKIKMKLIDFQCQDMVC